MMPQQLPLPLPARESFEREDFQVGLGNHEAVAFVDRWPDWPAPAAALFGPAGSGKTHLARIWAARTGATILEASILTDATPLPAGPAVIENLGETANEAAERALFALIERASPLLLTAREAPAQWPVAMPDLVSRFRALLAFPLWAPDDALLAALAKKLFSDRQLSVGDDVAREMVKVLERSPAAIRAFVARADEAALAQKRPITLPLVRALLTQDR